MGLNWETNMTMEFSNLLRKKNISKTTIFYLDSSRYQLRQVRGNGKVSDISIHRFLLGDIGMGRRISVEQYVQEGDKIR